MLQPKALGLSVGVFAGVGWLLFMLASLSSGYGKSAIMLMGPLHPGFTYSYGGAVWMGVLHFVGGFILGYVFAWLYNKLAKK